MSNRRNLYWFATGGLLVVVGVGLALTFAQKLPVGPVPIAFDREACHHCHMQIGEPRFAAQAQLADGRVLNFDDPGCLLAWRQRGQPVLRALWFHHLREERWLRQDAVGFVKVPLTPMGFGLGAVDLAEPGAIGLEAASAQLEAAHAR